MTAACCMSNKDKKTFFCMCENEGFAVCQPSSGSVLKVELCMDVSAFLPNSDINKHCPAVDIG